MNYRSKWDSATAAERYHWAKGFVSEFASNDSRTMEPEVISKKEIVNVLQRHVEGYFEGSYHAAIPIHVSHFDKDILDLPTTAKQQLAEWQPSVKNAFLHQASMQQERVWYVGLSGITHPKNCLSRNLDQYLQELAKTSEFSDGVVIRNARWLLSLLGRALNVDTMPTPQAAPSEESSLAFSWQTDNNQVGLYIYPTGKFDWLWRSRSTKEYEGDEDVDLYRLPWRLVLRLRNTLADR